MRTLNELTVEALEIQSACNLCGLAQRFAQVQIELGEYCNGTTERNQHPITRMWLDKMNSLAGIQAFEGSCCETINEAFHWAHTLVPISERKQ
jgi:hypothetical protein